MAFVLDVNLRIQEILGLQKIEAALAKLKGTAQVGAAAGAGAGVAMGGTGAVANMVKMQAATAATVAATTKATAANTKLAASNVKVAASTGKAAAGMGKAAAKAQTFGQAVKIAGRRYAAFLTATIVPFAALAGLTKATASVIEFDTAILKMRQITGETAQQMDGMRNTILDLATATGTSASEIARIGKIMAQAGFRGDQLAESLSALSRVPLTPSFETMDAAVEGTIAALNQFNKEGLTTTEILDVLTAVSNKFAASSEDIAKGISRGGAAFEAIGGTFREFVAVFTTIRHATRESSETVGTFMKTISSRLADPKIVDFLEGKGIRIGEAIEAGNPIEALKRIGAALHNITSIQDKIEIGTKLGGRRQISRLLALISNMDMLNDSLATGNASAGEFGKIAKIGLEGLQAQLNIMVQEWNKLAQTLAEPLFVPLIKMVTSAGKAFASIIDFAKPIIPALATIVGFAGAFKLLAVSIASAGKALAFMGTVGKTVGGGLAATTAAFGVGAAGGVAGATARERVQRRLAGGVGQAAMAGGIGARLAGGARGAAGAFAQSSMAQMAVMAGVMLAASKFSEAAEEAGSSADIFASETAKAASVIGIAAVALSGKSLPALAAGLGVIGGIAAVAAIAIGAMTYAANKAAEIDMKKAVDAIVKKVSELKVEPIEVGDAEGLQEAIGSIGTEAIKGVQAAASVYEDDWFDFFANASNRIKNLFTGEGMVTINDAEAQEIIDRIVGSNPEILNKILQSAIEQFGVGDIEAGIEQLLVKEFGGHAEVAGRIRQSMVKTLGGIERIATTIGQIQMDAKVSVLANAIEKASKDFDTLHVPSQLTYELSLLSDAVGNAARAIETNVTMFDQLSQMVGQDIGIAKPPTEWSMEAIGEIARTGKMGEFIDLSQLPALEGFTTDMAKVSEGLDQFIKSFVKSRAKANELRALLSAPMADPAEIMGEFIDNFVEQYPEKIPPEAVAIFKTMATKLGMEYQGLIADGVITTAEQASKAFGDIMGRENIFYEAGLNLFKKWMDAQSKQLNLALSGQELVAEWDVGTAELGSTILQSFQKALRKLGEDIDLSALDKGLMSTNEAIVDLARNSGIAKSLIDKYGEAFPKYAQLLREVTEASKTGEGATADLRKAYDEAAIEVLNLDTALEFFKAILQQSTQALAENQAEQKKSGRYLQITRDQGVITRRTGKYDEKAAKAAEEFAKQLDKSNQQILEDINRRRQLIRVQATIDVSQAFKEPADIFAEALIESANAVKAFTTALTIPDLQRGLGVLGAKVTPEGRVYPERRPVPEAQPIEQAVMERRHLQSALFGGDIGSVMEALLQAGAETAESKVFGQLMAGMKEEASVNKELAQSFRDFGGFIYDIPKMIQESGLDPTEVARVAAEALVKQAEVPGIREVEHIGALMRPVGDLAETIQTLIERPEVARDPEQLIPQLPASIQDLLQSLTPVMEQVQDPEAAPHVWEGVSDIQQAASETRLAADATARSTEEMKVASTNVQTGGTDILTASQNMTEVANQMRAVTDMSREALARPQEGIVGGTNGEGAQEAITATTEALNSFGERMDAMTQAVEIQTQQEAELATVEREKPLELPGLEENTDAITANNETTDKAQESMVNLNDGMSKVAGAMEEGIGIDIETMSNIKVDVQSIGAAASEFTSEFEAVAHKVAKEEIRKVLQQLARTAGSSEAATTFENAVG